MARIRREQRRGFTLIEAAMTTVIIGVGIVAMVDAQQAFMRSNNWSSEASSGAFLANEIREMTRFMPKHDPVTSIWVDVSGPSLAGWGPETNEFVVDDFDDIDDLDGLTFSAIGTANWADGDLPGPINGFGEVIPEIDFDGDVVAAGGAEQPMQGWTQRVSVEPIQPFDTSEELVITGALDGRELFIDDPRLIGVENYPLRVTVSIIFQGVFDTQPETVTELQWIVP